jgi:threonine/homoserine/homoserine lactone efflux protein
MNLVFEAIYKGLALGMALCLGVGPSFFALIQTSLNNGVRSGIALALGIFISDLACVLFAYLGVSQFFLNPGHKTVIGLVSFLLYLGCIFFFRRNHVPISTTKS